MERTKLETRNIFRAGLLVAIATLSLVLVSHNFALAEDSATLRNFKSGDKLPPIKLSTINDSAQQNFTFDNGKPGVIMFFSIRPDFRKKRSLALLSTLSDLADEYKTKINILGIFSDNRDLNIVKTFMDSSAKNIPVYNDREKYIYNQYGIFMMPLVVIADSDGRLHEVIPYTYSIRELVEGNIKLLLGEWDKTAFIKSLMPKETVIKSKEEKEYIRRINYGRIMLSKKMYDQASREFSNAVKLMPHLINAHIGLGFALLTSEKYDRAEASFREALKINPDSDDAFAGLGLTYYERGEMKSALIELEKAFIAPDPRLEVIIALAEIYEQKGLNKKAIRLNKLAVSRLMTTYNQRWK